MSETKTRKHDRRKRYLVNRKLQLHLISIVVGSIIAGSIFSLFFLYYLVNNTITATVDNFHPSLQKTSQAILPAFMYTNLITVTVISIAAFIIILYKSHKIAGPITRFEKDLAEIDKGNLKLNFRLRKHDHFKNAYQNLEKVANGLQLRIESLVDRTERIRGELNKLQASLQGMEDAEVVRCLDVLDKEVRELKNILSYYNVNIHLND